MWVLVALDDDADSLGPVKLFCVHDNVEKGDKEVEFGGDLGCAIRGTHENSIWKLATSSSSVRFIEVT